MQRNRMRITSVWVDERMISKFYLHKNRICNIASKIRFISTFTPLNWIFSTHKKLQYHNFKRLGGPFSFHGSPILCTFKIGSKIQCWILRIKIILGVKRTYKIYIYIYVDVLIFPLMYTCKNVLSLYLQAL